MGLAFVVICTIFELLHYFTLNWYISLANFKFLEVKKQVMIKATWLFRALNVHFPIVAILIWRIGKAKSTTSDMNSTCAKLNCATTAAASTCLDECGFKIAEMIIDTTDGKVKGPWDLLYRDMYQLLLAVTCARVFCYLIIVYAIPMIIYWSNYTFYFNHVSRKARAQADAYTDYANSENASASSMGGRLYSALGKNKFFEDKLVS